MRWRCRQVRKEVPVSRRKSRARLRSDMPRRSACAREVDTPGVVSRAVPSSAGGGRWAWPAATPLPAFQKQVSSTAADSGHRTVGIGLRREMQQQFAHQGRDLHHVAAGETLHPQQNALVDPEGCNPWLRKAHTIHDGNRRAPRQPAGAGASQLLPAHA